MAYIPEITYLDGDRAKKNHNHDSDYSSAEHTHVESDITDLEHDAVKIGGIEVDLTGIVDKDILIYNESEDKWLPSTPIMSSGSDGWNYLSTNPVYVSSTRIKFESANYLPMFPTGTKIKFDQTTTKYFYNITSGSYSGGDTLLDVYAGDDFTVVNAAITNFAYAHGVANGFPEIFSYAPTEIGFSSPPGGTILFSLNGKLCTIQYETFYPGTSNDTMYMTTIPIAQRTTSPFMQAGNVAVAMDNSALVFGAICAISGDLAVIMIPPTGVWTNSGAKAATFSASYFIE